MGVRVRILGCGIGGQGSGARLLLFFLKANESKQSIKGLKKVKYWKVFVAVTSKSDGLRTMSGLHWQE